MRQRRLMNQINVVPYIDVMLVLLVIFMVTAPLIQTGAIDLPSVGKSSQTPVSPLMLVIKADQTLASRGDGGKEQALGKAELARLLERAREKHQAVLIAADKSVRYEAVINMVDEINRAGLKVSLQVQQGR